jgi:dTDP-4-amino-4,6-dideoxygalactose transaminase
MIPITRPELPSIDAYTALLREVWDSRMLSNFGPLATQLEAQTTAYLGVPTRVVVSGDIGLTLTIAALDLPRGSACLVPSFTFNSTINAALWNGLRPVFVDIDSQSLTMDPADARAAAATEGDVSLILATHVFGNPADADGFTALATDIGARLVFDAAHGYGSIRGTSHVGTLGDAEVFSLSGTKPVTSGEGGIIASRDEELLDRIKLLRGYGFFGDYNSKLVGLNGKMSELHAALGLLAMARIEEALANRERLLALYHERLDALPGLTFQAVRDVDRSTFKDFAILFENGPARDRVEAALSAADVQTKRYFRPCHGMDAYRRYDMRPLPNTNDVHARILCVPLFEGLTEPEISLITATIGDALRAAVPSAPVSA